MPNIGSTGGAIPAGGTAGQTLTKNTGTDYDASWAAASSGGGGPQIPWTSGRIFTNYFGNLATAALSDIYLRFMPMRVPNACTISAVGVASGSSNNVISVGLYTDAGPSATSFGPGALVTNSNRTMTASNSGGCTYAAFSANIALAAGTYWIGYSAISGASFYGGPAFTHGMLAAVSAHTTLPAYLYNTGYGNGVDPGVSNFSTVTLSQNTTLAAFQVHHPMFCWKVV